jgi:hypothetical protein
MNPQSESIVHWIPIVGRWNFDQSGLVTYLGPQSESPHPYGICVQKLRFYEGVVRATISVPQQTISSQDELPSGRLLFGYQNADEEYFLAGIGGHGSAYTLVSHHPSSGWVPIAWAGSNKNLSVEQHHHVLVNVEGQKITLKIDETPVLTRRLGSPLPVGQLGLFAWGNGRVEFSDIFAEPKSGTAFVIMKFESPYKELYTHVIKPVVKKLEFKVFNAGELFGRLILEDIVRGIVTARVVIAEVTPANKNVFYELGYAHAMNKPTILLAEKETELPFDTGGYRHILYENSIEGIARLKGALEDHLKAMFPVE